LIGLGDSVAIVGYKDSTLFTLIENDNVLIKKYIVPEMDDFFVSISEQSYLSALGQTIIDDFSGQEIYVLASYIDVLHRAMHVFNGDVRVRLLTGILHPEAWSIWEPGIGFNSARAFKPKKINRLWHYQRQLLLRLDRNNAIWYLNDTHRKYNEYYFETELTFNGSVAIPVEPSSCAANISYSTPTSEIRVLWLGRFDFFKNPCILRFIDELESLLIERADLEITFDLIGYGVGCYEREIKSYAGIKKERLKINFLGKKKVSDICKVVESGGYHFGLAMGTSTYHLAMMGLPVVVIEACANDYQKFMRGMWLDDASEEYDDGSALYLALAGKHVTKRRIIKDLLSDIFIDGFLQNKSKHCRDYVEKYHSVDILMPKIRNLLLSSTYCEKFVYTFNKNMPDEFYHRFGKARNISVAIFGIGSGA
ncbi:hypothetical protein, partial [Aeromonas finlandensis]|uniref:hypothetical protein n=1 Tax=Aeromonas finlandensis TaxID=1543375 RepID=UPI00138E075A